VAVIKVVPGRTEVQLVAHNRASWVPPILKDVPGGLYPMMSAAFEVDEYRILDGWPVPVPEFDVQINVMVSAEGDALGNRDEPTALTTNADMRWIADSNYYDQTSLTWTPIQSDAPPWTTTPEHAPSLISDYEYRIGDERFVGMTALNFDSNTDDYLWNDLSLYMGGAEGYTVVMVLCPNSIYGNDPDVVDKGLWGPANTDGAWHTFTVRDQALCMTTELNPVQKGVAIGNALASTAPTFLAMVVGRPQTTLYAGPGPSNLIVKSLPSGVAPTPLSTHFWLGNAPSSATGTMDMALLDLGIYGNPLTNSEVVAEFAALSSIYGGDT
jgi:hypothetical protein